MYESWGEKLLTPTSYDPKKDFLIPEQTLLIRLR